MRSLQEVLTMEYRLNLAGWSLHTAKGVSDDGRVIVGYGIGPDGLFEAWVAEIPAAVPEPSTWCLLMPLVVGVCRRRVRRRSRTA